MGRTAIDIWRGFVFDNPAQVAFLRSPARYRLLSSGFGAGKSKLLCRESIRIALEYPGSRNLIARLKSTELAATTAKTFERELREIGLEKGLHYTVNKNEGTYYWRNGSETIFSHLESDEKFGSSEFSSIAVDEGSQVSDDIYEILFPGRLRWNVGPHRAWICTNPGSSGFLRKIVYGELVGTGTEAVFTRGDGRPERVTDEFAWFPVPPGANKHNPPGYNEQIARLGKTYGPHWYARYVQGDWDSFEGQRFPMFDREKHVLKESFRPDGRHRIVEGWDFGHRETFVAWLAYDPEGSEPVVCFAELQAQEVQEPSDVADRVKEIRARYGLSRVTALGDPAGTASSQFSAVSPIAAYGALGLHIAPCRAGKSPTSRADLLAEFLSGEVATWGGKTWPGIVFNPECEAVVRSIVNLRWDVSTNSKGEDPREKFLKKDDHGFDACLVPGTMVATPDGDVPIEDVRAGDMVLTRAGARRVEQAWMTSPDAPVLRVTTSDGRTITGTGNHLVNANNGWKRLDALTYGDIPAECPGGLRSSTGCAGSAGRHPGSTDTPRTGSAPVSVVSVTDAGTSPVYDLTVEGEHEFFANGLLVHNCTYALVGVPPPRVRAKQPFRPEPGVNQDAAMARRLLAG